MTLEVLLAIWAALMVFMLGMIVGINLARELARHQ